MTSATYTLIGTDISETIEGTSKVETIIALAGDDTINARDGADIIYGDFTEQNLLAGTEGVTGFAQFGQTDAWVVQEESNGHTSMSQTVTTHAGVNYSISFEMAANYGTSTLSGAVEVLWNGVVIDSFNTNSAAFEAHTVSFEGTDGEGQLTFRSIDSTQENTLNIQTDAPIFYYETDMQIGNDTVNVNAFAPGQSGIYQVINGELHVFDPINETYSSAGAEATVVVNAIGFNQEDNMIYGIAVGNGSDSLGNQVDRTDLVMLDASGNSYRIGETPYASWTGDFDDNGNLWAFHSSMDRVTMIDVDNLDANGNPSTTTFKFAHDMVTDKVWDVTYDAQTQMFYGVVSSDEDGGTGQLMCIDISAVPSNGQPVFSTIELTGTMVDGSLQVGIPQTAYGAAMIDGDGNLYVGGNRSDHDLNPDTAISGGIYAVHVDQTEGTGYLELVSDAPRSYSNDGAIDPRSADPFDGVDVSASVLIRSLDLTPTEQDGISYDDQINAGAGHDEVYGGLGDDQIIGASSGDILIGGVGDDALYGGAGPDWQQNGLISIYDDEGIRYDQFGNILPEDDDTIYGGVGDDVLDGSAGHDYLDGGTGDDDIFGGTGQDILHGGDGQDYLNGGAQDDQLYGDYGDDTIIGGSGDDELNGGNDNDDLQGGSGDDILKGGLGDDLLLGGNNDDYLFGGYGDDRLEGGSHNDVLTDIAGLNYLFGGSGDDFLYGGSDIDTLNGGSGNDELWGSDDNDIVKGGPGNDTLYGGDDNDKLYGGSGNDVIDGGDGKDYINACSGDDIIFGGANNDKIISGAGNDIISGGAGSDWFVFRSDDLGGFIDIIEDFLCNADENDRLDLRSLNLVQNGETNESWMAENITQNAEWDIMIALGDSSITLIDSYNLGDDFMDEVTDGLWL